MSARPGLPGIPDPGPGPDPQARAALNALKEIVEVREGRRGNPLDRAVTLRDLVQLGLIEEEAATGQ